MTLQDGSNFLDASIMACLSVLKIDISVQLAGRSLPGDYATAKAALTCELGAGGLGICVRLLLILKVVVCDQERGCGH